MLATYLSQIFFPKIDPIANMLGTLAVFAVGYLARPLGGLIFGHYADKYGRKKTFLTSISLMAFSTVMIGLLPSYEKIGVLSTTLLVILRLIQGVAQGAELPGAITFIAEHASYLRRGSRLGLMMFAVGIGAMLSTFVNFLLHVFLNSEQVLAWGWRIPFLIGAILAIVGYYLRRNTHESPIFLRDQDSSDHVPIFYVLRHHAKTVIEGTLLTLFPASFILFALFLPTYIQQYYNYASDNVYLAMTFGLLWSALLLPFFGWLSDFVGRKRLFITAALASLLTIYSLFQLLSFGGMVNLYVFIILYQTLVSMLAACYPSQLAELFITKVRYTGVGICYNVSFCLAAFLPMLASMLLAYTQNPISVCFIFLPLAFISTLVVIYTTERTASRL